MLGAALAEHVDTAHLTWTSIHRALAQYATVIQAEVERIDVVAQLVYQTPTLAARVREYRSLWQEWTTDILATSGDVERASLIAPIILATLYQGQAIWLASSGATTLSDAMEQAIEQARAALPRD